MTPGHARMLVLECLAKDERAWQAEILYGDGQFEQARRSGHGIIRLLLDGERSRQDELAPPWYLASFQRPAP